MKYAAVVLLATLGCEAEEDAPSCVARDGAYQQTSVQRNGDCGPLEPAALMLTPDVTALGPSCSGGASTETGSCVESVYDASCPIALEDFGLATGVMDAEIDWSADASNGTGYIMISAYDGADLLCEGTYDVTYMRL